MRALKQQRRYPTLCKLLEQHLPEVLLPLIVNCLFKPAHIGFFSRSPAPASAYRPFLPPTSREEWRNRVFNETDGFLSKVLTSVWVERDAPKTRIVVSTVVESVTTLATSLFSLGEKKRLAFDPDEQEETRWEERDFMPDLSRALPTCLSRSGDEIACYSLLPHPAVHFYTLKYTAIFEPEGSFKFVTRVANCFCRRWSVSRKPISGRRISSQRMALTAEFLILMDTNSTCTDSCARLYLCDKVGGQVLHWVDCLSPQLGPTMGFGLAVGGCYELFVTLEHARQPNPGTWNRKRKLNRHSLPDAGEEYCSETRCEQCQKRVKGGGAIMKVYDIPSLQVVRQWPVGSGIRKLRFDDNTNSLKGIYCPESWQPDKIDVAHYRDEGEEGREEPSSDEVFYGFVLNQYCCR